MARQFDQEAAVWPELVGQVSSFNSQMYNVYIHAKFQLYIVY